MFRRSSERKRTWKILAWGPPGAGKSHFGYSAPQPAILNWENRAAPGGDRFEYVSVVPGGVSEGLAAIAEIRAGNVECESVVLDSLAKPYQLTVRHFTTESTGDGGRTSSTVDWAAVNRTMLRIIDPLIALPDVNVIAIARQAVALERNGRDFKRAGVKAVGDMQRWAYDFDFILHFTGRGLVTVEKSMSEHLPVDSTIKGDLDFARFVRLAAGQESLDGKTVAPAEPHKTQTTAALEAALALLSDEERAEIGAAARAKSVAPARLLLHIRSITGGDKPLPRTSFALLVDLLEKEAA